MQKTLSDMQSTNLLKKLKKNKEWGHDNLSVNSAWKAKHLYAKKGGGD